MTNPNGVPSAGGPPSVQNGADEQNSPENTVPVSGVAQAAVLPETSMAMAGYKPLGSYPNMSLGAGVTEGDLFGGGSIPESVLSESEQQEVTRLVSILEALARTNTPLTIVQPQRRNVFRDHFGFSRFRGTCAEQALCFIADRLGLTDRANFNLADYQVGLDFAMDLFGLAVELSLLEFDQTVHLHDGTELGIQMWLANLDPNQCYLVRRGTVGGDGHHCVLYYDGVSWCWFNRSGEPTAPLTTATGNVDFGLQLFDAQGQQWGGAMYCYNLTAYPMDRHSLLNLVNLVRNYRAQQAQRLPRPQFPR